MSNNLPNILSNASNKLPCNNQMNCIAFESPKVKEFFDYIMNLYLSNKPIDITLCSEIGSVQFSGNILSIEPSTDNQRYNFCLEDGGIVSIDFTKCISIDSSIDDLDSWEICSSTEKFYFCEA